MEKRKQIQKEDATNGEKDSVTKGKNGTEFGKRGAEQFAEERQGLIDKQSAADEEKQTE